jgi:parallel beta-helix repeat protein
VLDSSSNNTLSGNNVTANNWYGIWLDSSSDNNVLSGNNIANNLDGITLYSSSDNTLSGNNVTANNNYGITLSFSSNNSIFHNNFVNNHKNFVNNTNQVYTDGLANIWDNGSVGNYWSDYLTKYPNATQVDSSGVWNTPYVIDTNNTDYYPLTVPYAIIPEFPPFLILPLFFIATLLTVIIYKEKGVKTSQS